jgi:leucyl aminopeptidase
VSISFADSAKGAVDVHIVGPGGLDDFLKDRPEVDARWVRSSVFTGALGQVLRVPSQDGGTGYMLYGWGDAAARGRVQYPLGSLPGRLPEGSYRLADLPDDAEALSLTWLLAGYTFRKYRETEDGQKAKLVAPDGVDADRVEALATSVALTRDLINTPTNDMGPDQLEAAFRALGKEFDADVKVIKGDALLKQNFPMIHAVGRASDQEPRLLDMRWGTTGPTVTLVGKGVCFDTGGLNIKPGNSMGLMKKDMGGSATTIGLARMIMALDLPVRLRLLVPAVENSISAGAFRPGDILTSRKGLTVEINNTDAEGRLVLADALAYADEEAPDYMFCMATLTGAARVAMGPDVPPFFCDQDDLAGELQAAGARVSDPIWRLPFWDGYETRIEPGIADLDNAPSGGFAGAITAALFLRRFVEDAKHFAHFDVYGWTPSPRPARPKGGECQAARAIFDVLEQRHGKTG